MFVLLTKQHTDKRLPEPMTLKKSRLWRKKGWKPRDAPLLVCLYQSVQHSPTSSCWIHKHDFTLSYSFNFLTDNMIKKNYTIFQTNESSGLLELKVTVWSRWSPEEWRRTESRVRKSRVTPWRGKNAGMESTDGITVTSLWHHSEFWVESCGSLAVLT